MAWVKALPARGDDVFDEEEDDINLQNKEWKCNMEKRVKEGYRDGVDAGKEASLQDGFNMGYREAAGLMGGVGQLKGILSAVQCWCELQQLHSPTAVAVAQLLQDVVQHEEGQLEMMRSTQERLQPSIGDISDSIEDLGVAQGESKRYSKDEPKSGDRHRQRSHCWEQLLQRSMVLVAELGLPEGLIQHLQQLASVQM